LDLLLIWRSRIKSLEKPFERSLIGMAGSADSGYVSALAAGADFAVPIGGVGRRRAQDRVRNARCWPDLNQVPVHRSVRELTISPRISTACVDTHTIGAGQDRDRAVVLSSPRAPLWLGVVWDRDRDFDHVLPVLAERRFSVAEHDLERGTPRPTGEVEVQPLTRGGTGETVDLTSKNLSKSPSNPKESPQIRSNWP
jgi:hypothetical protein